MEWSIDSPPPAYNFAQIPQVRGLDHYWIVKREAAANGNPITGPEAPVNPATIHMPSPSYWPLVTAIGVLIMGAGMLIDVGWPYIRFPIPFIGGIISFIGIVAWSNEPATKEGVSAPTAPASSSRLSSSAPTAGKPWYIITPKPTIREG